VAPDAKLVVVKVMDRDGACYLSDAIKALDWCLENKDKYGIKIISFSVGGEGPSEGNSILDDACNNVVDKGITMVVAAGNSGPYPASIVMPGDASKVITVGAIDNKGEIFEKSSRGPTPEGEVKPDLVTLGVDVVSALAGSANDYSPVSGTSMAVPQVSGSAALILEAEPDLKPADIKRVLVKTADDLGDPEPDNVYGYGSLNLTRALEEMGRLGSMGAELKAVDLSITSATVGDPVVIEARAHGDVKEVKSVVRGPGDSMEMSMDDFDNNGTYSTWLDTSLLAPGSYEIEVDLEGEYGEAVSRKVPFQLRPRS
jgi:serine protease AprX